MKTLFTKLAFGSCALLLFAQPQVTLAIQAPTTNNPIESTTSSNVQPLPKASEALPKQVSEITPTPTIVLPKPMTGVKAGLTPVATVAELKTALENGESVQLTADITLDIASGLSSSRISIGKNNAQDITIDGADPLTGQHHRLDIADPSEGGTTTQLHIGTAAMAGKTVQFTNLAITNTNYYGICRPTNNSYGIGSTLLLNNITYTGSAQALHFHSGVVAFTGNNNIQQTTGFRSQELAETGRLDFRGGTTYINHAGSADVLTPTSNPEEGITGIQVTGGADVTITTNQSIIGSTGLLHNVDIAVSGTNSNLTMNAASYIFNATGTASSNTKVGDGATLTVNQAIGYSHTSSGDQSITATDNSAINLQLAGSLYNSTQSASPMTAINNSTIAINTTNTLFNAIMRDSPVVAILNSEISLKSDKDLFSSLYNTNNANSLPLIEADATSKLNLTATDAFIRNAQTNGAQFDISGELNATFGQFYANATARPMQYDFRDGSTVNLTINGTQSVANGIIPLVGSNSYMKIGDRSKVTLNNQTTTTQPLLQGASTGNSPLSIGDSDVTFNNNAVADSHLFQYMNVRLENDASASPHTIYRGAHLTEKNQTESIFPFVHFTSIINTGNVTASSDDTFTTKLTNLTSTKDIAQLHLHDPLPPEITTLENPGGLPADDAQQFDFDLHGTATPGSELTVNFLDAGDQSLLSGLQEPAASNHDFKYQWQADIPSDQHKIVLDANYPAPYTLTNPTRRILKDIPPAQLAFLKVPTHFDFGSIPLTNSQSPVYDYEATSDADLLVSDPRSGSRGDWSVQVNLTKPFTATPNNQPAAILQDAIIWTKDAHTAPLQLNIPQQLFKKEGYSPAGAAPDVDNLTDTLKNTLQAQFPAGAKHADVPYTAELEFILVSAPN